ncbi:MAG: leucine-rich repeat domain-containing protein [Treponema sp.]|nr:leucine-rich repeat domain-containing protein [Treponema sp.]
MAKRIIVTILMICLVFGTAAAQARETARGHITQGQEHMASENFAGAVASFEAALRLERNNRQAQTLLREAQEKRMGQAFANAQDLVKENKFPEAIALFNLAIQYAPPGYNTRNIQTARNDAQRAMVEYNERTAQAEAQAKAAAEQAEAQAKADAEAQQTRERTEQSQQAVKNANELFINGRYPEAIALYDSALSLGGLTAAETTETQRLIAEAREIQELMTSFNRPLRDEDFDVLQNRDATITIVKYKAAGKKTVRIAGTEHSVYYGILNVGIPSRLYNQNVTIIGPNSFQDMGLTSVVIPEWVTEIGAGAFANNRLERVTFGIRLRFIRGVNPEGRMEVAAPGAFEGNTRLNAITIPNTVTEIGTRAFRNCGLTTLSLGTQVNTIGESAFRDNRLAVVTLPNSIRHIRRYAFHGNQIQSMTLPQGIETVYDDAFTNNPMTAVVIPPSLAQLITLNGQPCPRIGGDHVLLTAHIPSFPDTLERVTFPANVNDRNLNGFEENLRNFYIGQNRAAGTYVKRGPIWSRQ